MAHKKQQGKMRKVMGEFKRGELRSSSDKGPKVKNRKQAEAIALSESGQSREKATRRKRLEGKPV
jgi:hypothetical protein